MAKFKVSYNDSQILVKCKLDRAATINQKELDIFNSKFIRGFMRPRVAGNRKIEYTASGNTTLKSFLRSGISKKDFYIVFAQLIECINKIEHYDFNINNLFMDTQYTFYNQVTGEVQFLYQPLNITETKNNIFLYMYEIACETVLNLDENVEFLNDLINFTNGLQVFSVATMEAYLMSVYPQVYKTVNKTIFGDSTNLNTADRTYFNKNYDKNFKEMSDTIAFIDEEMPDTVAFTDEEMPDTVAFIDEEMPDTIAFTDEEMPDTVAFTDEEMPDTIAFTDEEMPDTVAFTDEEMPDTIAFIDDEMPMTVALDNDINSYANKIPIATIKRVSNGDVAQISKSDFLIGKQHDKVDYCISDNNTISRMHAVIKYENNSFYLIDLGSSNRSYVDGVLANPEERYTLFKGTRFFLSNEEFIFNIE